MPSFIFILMSTYNGKDYLAEQLNSIIEQTCKDWQLLIRDDGSTDGTPEIIKSYIRQYPHKIRLLSDPEGHLAASGSFFRLLKDTGADYIMFADQDDVWLPDKIEISLKKMKEMEKKHGIDTPLLVHSDLKVADTQLNVLSGSFWRYQHLNPQTSVVFSRLLMQNTVTGCTMLINDTLRRKIVTAQERIIVYDWWIALIAAAFGKIDYVNAPTVLYRQHMQNTVGAKLWGWRYITDMALSGRSNMKHLIGRTQKQAAALLEIYGDELPEHISELLSIYSTMDSLGWLQKRLYLIRYNLLKVGFRRNIGLLLTI
jgi:glycosyltransferase involved in cell wall biosynthesis